MGCSAPRWLVAGIEGIDSEMIAGLIAEYGQDGSRRAGAEMEGEGGRSEGFRNPFTIPDPSCPPPPRDSRKK